MEKVLNFGIWIKELTSRFHQPLPGEKAQLQMAPASRKVLGIPSDALLSSVLILLYPIKNEIFTVVIQRSDYDGAHSGQISLPGGKHEEEDLSFQATALREAYEETGIVPHSVQIIGELSPLYIPPSNFIVYPFVGYSESRPDFKADPIEVSKIIEFRLFALSDNQARIKRKLSMRNNQEIEVPGFLIDGNFVWGATAMIFSELVSIIS